ncbi:DNA methyltransferase [Peribacillus frigoritolerans]
METKLLLQVKKVLSTFPQYWDGETLIKTKVIEDIRSYKQELFERLLENELVNKTYSLNFKGGHVFKTDEFISMLRYKNYWDNSYTKFSNEIGLTSNEKYLKYNTDIVLDFPYKDCVLEGGMTKEKQGKKELYYHKVLAREEIDVMLAPKVFSKIKRFSENGIDPVTNFDINDNFVIKGNNLIVLHTLNERFAGQVKLIYIDPPYNTGDDSFKYNDRFSHASWLTFMKNRLEIASKLLREDGLILISIDDGEQAELKLLCNEIFGKGNFLANLVWNLKTGTQAGHFTRSHEYVLAFAKNKAKLPNFEGGEGFIEHSALKKISVKNPSSTFTFPKGTRFDAEDGTELIDSWGDSEKTFLISGRMKAKDGVLEEEVELEAGWAMKTQMKNWFKGENTFDSKGQKVVEFYFNKSGILKYKKERGVINPKTVLDDVGSTKTGTNHLKELFDESDTFAFPKNELLIERLISLTTKEGDLFLDFFVGSGTSIAVANKLGRRYIGVEQMDYIENITVERLKKVIDGEMGGISVSENWSGGGSFVFAELKELNQQFVNQIQLLETTDQLISLLNDIKEKAFFDYRVSLDVLTNDDSEFKSLTLDEQKKIVINSLDANQLYLNYSEIDDTDYDVSDIEKEFNRTYYSNTTQGKQS